MLRGISDAIESFVSAAIGLLFLARTDGIKKRKKSKICFPLLVNLLFESLNVANGI